jgi:hypothetical protein
MVDGGWKWGWRGGLLIGVGGDDDDDEKSMEKRKSLACGRDKHASQWDGA